MSEQKSEKRKNNNDDLVDCERASRNVWLVKVPRYLSEIWEKNAGTDVGQLIQIDGDQVDFVSTTPDEPVAEQPAPSIPSNSAPINPRRPDAPFAVKPVGRKPMANISVPKKHSFKFRAMDNQSLGVLLEDKTHLREDADQRSGKLIFEGKVTTRAECRPPNSEQYMRMKMEMICKASQPNRIVKKVDRAVVTFKPKAQHAENVMKEKSKKDQGARTARAGRDAVLDMIFAAFEKHQYYKLVDLQAITKQPQNFIRDLLNDIAVYNTAPPHKNMWELKPEYRNYKPTRNVEDPAAFECLLSIDEVGGIKKFAAMPHDCFTHLTIHDSLGRIATGFNTYKDLSVWAAKAGRKQIDATSYASIIEALKPDSYVTLSDYDTPFDTQKKRFGKCVTRTKTWNDAFFAGDNNGINRGVIATIGGGLNADTRLEIAKNYLSMPKIDAFSIELWHFSLGPNVDKKQPFEKDVVTELILPTLLSLPPNKIRLIEGAFNPSQILHLIKLGVDLVDSSYVSLLAEDGKAFFIADDFETTGDFTVLDFHDACYISEKAKISDKCPCYTCKTFTKAYLRHLVDCKEMLFMVLLTIHNMTEFDRMFQRIRDSLALI